jgi:hypothetical protein
MRASGSREETTMGEFLRNQWYLPAFKEIILYLQ